MSIEIIKDFVPPAMIGTLHQKVTSTDMKWVYTEESTMVGLTDPRLFVNDENTIVPCQFTNLVFADNRSFDKDLFMYCDFVFQFASELLKIEPVEFYRVKINLLTKDVRFTADKHGIAHSDVWEVTEDRSYKSLLFYLNDSDGDTFMFNEYATNDPATKLTLNQRITPQAGTAVYFDSSRFHSSSNPVSSKSRYVINYTFKI